MQSLPWYFNRLGRMSGAELAHRVSQLVRGVTGRFVGAAHSAYPAPEFGAAGIAPFVHRPDNLDAVPYVAQAARIQAGEYRVFDLQACQLGSPPDWNRDPLTRTLAPLRRAAALDYRDQRLVGNIKYLWEPNRHLHLAPLAQAYALTGEIGYALEVRRQVESWIDRCPVGRGPNWSSALELAIRLINWSVAWQLLGGERSALFSHGDGQAFRDRWLKSVYHHSQAISGNLSRFSSANNHLIGELAGICIAAATWPYWPQLRERGLHCRKLLLAQALEQNAPDGGNREQAVSYQQFVLDFLLLAGLAARNSGHDFAPAYWERIERMIGFVATLMDVGGHMPMIGDADDGFVLQLAPEPGFCPWRSLLATGAVLFERADFAAKAGTLDAKTRWLLGAQAESQFRKLLAGADIPVTTARALSGSGYYLLGDQLDSADEVRLLVDAGPLGYLSLAAHGHADALSVVLSVGGQEILIDPGTYCYHTEPAWRRYFRGTSAHNTVVVDDQDQSQQSGSFMWSKHARARCLEFSRDPTRQRFIGEHDGFRRLRDPVIHRREVVFDETSRGFEIADTLLCKGRHRIARRWHLAEGLEPVARNGGVEVRAAHFTVTIAALEEQQLRIINGGSAQEGGWVSRSFGRKLPCTTLEWQTTIDGPTTLRTRICVV